MQPNKLLAIVAIGRHPRDQAVIRDAKEENKEKRARGDLPCSEIGMHVGSQRKKLLVWHTRSSRRRVGHSSGGDARRRSTVRLWSPAGRVSQRGVHLRKFALVCVMSAVRDGVAGWARYGKVSYEHLSR